MCISVCKFDTIVHSAIPIFRNCLSAFIINYPEFIPLVQLNREQRQNLFKYPERVEENLLNEKIEEKQKKNTDKENKLARLIIVSASYCDGWVAAFFGERADASPLTSLPEMTLPREYQRQHSIDDIVAHLRYHQGREHRVIVSSTIEQGVGNPVFQRMVISGSQYSTNRHIAIDAVKSSFTRLLAFLQIVHVGVLMLKKQMRLHKRNRKTQIPKPNESTHGFSSYFSPTLGSGLVALLAATITRMKPLMPHWVTDNLIYGVLVVREATTPEDEAIGHLARHGIISC
ncbi:hypothetical protein CRG98_007958 [Punica granatum]|uniref:Uncharacterized protein n=1 Tax=Punica granatum TaxID=22663 RepID=A0A2I0KT26_PUNGR|nr:hypothetical protein CRG98_007958 [Punica granatum]